MLSKEKLKSNLFMINFFHVLWLGNLVSIRNVSVILKIRRRVARQDRAKLHYWFVSTKVLYLQDRIQ